MLFFFLFFLSSLHFCCTLLEHACIAACVASLLCGSAWSCVHDVTRLPLQTAQLLGTKQVSIFRDNRNYLGCGLGFKTFAPVSRPRKVARVI